jgi:hypothetical protein
VSDRVSLDGEPPAPPAPTRRRRIRLPVVLGLILLVVLIAVQAGRNHDRNTPLPPGAFGQTIHCLQRNTLLKVTDARRQGNGLPSRRTTAVDVTSAQHDTLLAEIRHYPSAAAARAARPHDPFTAPAGDYLQDGADLWAWIPGGTPPHLLSDAGERAIITACVRRPAS